jgi:diguanylate cyclase (GGDEF)-like protein
MDLDQFKRINDTFGHAAGDMLLRQVAQRLREGTSEDDFVARISGDEFVLLLTDDLSVADIGLAMWRLQERFSTPFLIEGQEVYMHWSLGLSVYPDDAREPDELLSCADAAMYRAKRAGGGHTVFQAHQDRHSPLEVERLSALHHAIERDELRLYAQPIVRAHDHVVVGHEALLRWERPSGMVSPLDFIPLAETSGLIVPIGRWVLQAAVKALKEGRVWEMAVNVSAMEFRQPDFLPFLRGVLAESGVEPQQLWLELTERSLLESSFASVLHELHTLGVRTSLDDFGTGYSSLTALASLPVQALKVDRSFASPPRSGRTHLLGGRLWKCCAGS